MLQGEAFPLPPGEAETQIQRSTVPVFIVDATARRFVWANAAALQLQGGISLTDFQQRPFEETVREYLPSLDAEVENLLQLKRPIYRKHSIIVGYRIYCFAVTLALAPLENGNQGVIIEARHDLDNRKNYVRATEALDKIPAIVTMTLIDGRKIYANELALKTYGEALPILPKRMIDVDDGKTLTKILLQKGFWRGVTMVATLGGERWHAITVNEIRDSISGLPAYVTCEIDMTDAIKAAEAAGRSQNECPALRPSTGATSADKSFDLSALHRAICEACQMLS